MKRVCQRSREVLKCEIRRGTNVRKRYSKLCCCWDGSSVVYSTQYVYSTGGTHVVRFFSTAVPGTFVKTKKTDFDDFRFEYNLLLLRSFCFFTIYRRYVLHIHMYCRHIHVHTCTRRSGFTTCSGRCGEI